MDKASQLKLEKAELAAKLKGSLLLFIQSFFPILTGRDFIISRPIGRESHFITICRALTQCTRLESLRLLINVPPGHGKSVIVSFWIAWCYAKWDDCNFLYISYSKTLATSHTETIKRIMLLPQYKALFGVHLREDSQAKDAFSTEGGGTVASFGSAGAITGRNAGLPGLERFSGAVLCFPCDEYVQTELGAIKIGEIVDKKLDIKVYSVDLSTREIQLKPIIGYFENPGSPIIEIEFSDGAIIRCTPCHKIWTDNRGWVEAKDLLVSDELPTPSTDTPPINSKIFRGIRVRQRKVFQHVKLAIGKIFKYIASSSRTYSYSKFRPCFSSPNLVDSSSFYSKIFSNIFSRIAIDSSLTNFNHFESVKLSSRPIFPSRESSVLYSILHVFGFRPIANIVSSIISRISVKMPNLHPYLLFANKSPRNQPMHIKVRLLCFFTQGYSMVSLPNRLYRGFKNFFRHSIEFRFPRFFSASFINNPFFSFNSTKTGNTIKSLVSSNRTPLLIRYIGHVDKTYCINVETNHNFILGLCKYLIVSNCDDMHKPDEVHSDLVRESVITNFRETIQQRPRGINVPIVFIGQRLHEQDLPAYFLAGEDGYKWDNVILKSLDEAGNALYPEAFPVDMLRIRQDKDRYVFAAQHQQDPQPSGGGLYTAEDFPLLDDEPEFYITFITADTAETEDPRNDATVFSFWGLYNIETEGRKTGVMAIHWIGCRELRVEPKHLEREFLDFWQECARHKNPPLIAYIEKKSTGVTLISILKEMRGLKVREIERTRKSGSKSQRFIDIQPYIAAKQLSLPAYGAHTEMCVNHMKRITNNDSHAFDDVCFVAGTLIATPFGNKPIETIKVGDKVITPMGIGNVTASGVTHYNAKVITRNVLTGTSNHPIFCNHNFKSLDTLEDADKFSSLTFKELIKWRYKKLLCLMESDIALWDREGIILASQRIIKEEKILKDFMWQFMNFIAKRQFQKVILFTIRMAITLIMTLVTWNVFHISNIWQNIKKRRLLGVNLKKIGSIFKRHKKQQKNGMEVKKEGHGIGKMLKQVYIDLKNMFVKDVGLNICFLRALGVNSAIKHVMVGIEGNTYHKLQLNANGVEKNSNVRRQRANLNSANSVANNAQPKQLKHAVYNITVEGYGVYYANNLLVSNCDTAADAVKIALIDKQLSMFTSKSITSRESTIAALNRHNNVILLKQRAYKTRN